MLDGGNRVAAELSAVITHAANHRQTSGHLHVGNAGSEHNMFLCFVFFAFNNHSFRKHGFIAFSSRSSFCGHWLQIEPPNMSEHVADVRVVSVQPCVYVLHHTTFSMVASVYSG